MLQEYGKYDVNLLDRQIREDYLNALTNLSYKTHQLHQTIRSALFNFAIKQSYINANPIARIKVLYDALEQNSHISSRTK